MADLYPVTDAGVQQDAHAVVNRIGLETTARPQVAGEQAEAERVDGRDEARGAGQHVAPVGCLGEAVRVVDMSTSNAWAELAAVFCRTRGAFLEHESAKAELKRLMPEDAKEAIGHGLRAKRSKSGAVSFELMEMEAADAPLQ